MTLARFTDTGLFGDFHAEHTALLAQLRGLAGISVETTETDLRRSIDAATSPVTRARTPRRGPPGLAGFSTPWNSPAVFQRRIVFVVTPALVASSSVLRIVAIFLDVARSCKFVAALTVARFSRRRRA